MSLSEHAIKINFQKARQQAAKLDEIADTLKNLSEHEFADTMQTIRNNWRGENADIYINKGFNLQGNMTQTANSFHAIASEIRTIAQRIYDAEMNALRIAQHRKY